MAWTEEVQLRFNDLRQKELAGTLSANEKNDLTMLFTVLEADEKHYLAGAIARMQTKQEAIQVKAQENRQLQQRISELEEEIARLHAFIRCLTNENGAR